MKLGPERGTWLGAVKNSRARGVSRRWRTSIPFARNELRSTYMRRGANSRLERRARSRSCRPTLTVWRQRRRFVHLRGDTLKRCAHGSRFLGCAERRASRACRRTTRGCRASRASPRPECPLDRRCRLLRCWHRSSSQRTRQNLALKSKTAVSFAPPHFSYPGAA